MYIGISTPLELNFNELEKITQLIAEGNETNIDNLFSRVMRCVRICRIFDNNKLVAVGAIKAPSADSRHNLQLRIIQYEKGKELFSLNNIYYELGYLSVLTEFRGKGLSKILNESLLFELNHSVYTTIRETNSFLEKNLLFHKFEKIGTAKSTLKPETSLTLYARNAP